MDFCEREQVLELYLISKILESILSKTIWHIAICENSVKIIDPTVQYSMLKGGNGTQILMRLPHIRAYTFLFIHAFPNVSFFSLPSTWRTVEKIMIVLECANFGGPLNDSAGC
jgi:hypothetical protein